MADVQANPLAGGASPSRDSTLRKRFSDDGDTPADQSSPDRYENKPLAYPSAWTSGWLMKRAWGVGDSLKSVAEEPDLWTEDHELLVSGWRETGSVLREAQESLKFDSVSFWWEYFVHTLAPVSQILMGLYFIGCRKGGKFSWAMDHSHAHFNRTAQTDEEHDAKRGKHAGKFHAKLILSMLSIFRVVPIYCLFHYYDQLADAQVSLLFWMLILQTNINSTQIAAKHAFQRKSADERLHNGVERRRNEFIGSFLPATLDTIIFEMRLAAARNDLNLEERVEFECSRDELLFFLAPVLHTTADPNKYSGRRPGEAEITAHLDARNEVPSIEFSTEQGLQKRQANLEELRALDTAEMVCSEGEEDARSSVPMKVVFLRAYW
jgi:hypothetical protein